MLSISSFGFTPEDITDDPEYHPGSSGSDTGAGAGAGLTTGVDASSGASWYEKILYGIGLLFSPYGRGYQYSPGYNPNMPPPSQLPNMLLLAGGAVIGVVILSKVLKD